MRALYCAPNKCNFDPEIDKIDPPCSEKVKFIELQAKFGTVFLTIELFPFKTPIRYETPVIKLHTVTDSIGFGTRTLALLGLNF